MMRKACKTIDGPSKTAERLRVHKRAGSLGSLIAICLCLLFSETALAGAMGVGYHQGKNGGLAICYNLSNRLRTAVPISFENVIIDYHYFRRNLGYHLSMRLSFYFGVGTDVSIGSGKKKNKGKGDIGVKAALRFPMGIMGRVSGYPIDIFIEMAPTMDFFDGSEFELDQGDLKWQKAGFGFRYYF